MRYFKLRLTTLGGDFLFETDFLADQFENFVRHLASGLVQQGAFRPNEYYNARVIPRVDDNPSFERVSLLKASEVPNDGYGFLDILFEQVELPIDPVTYLTLQLRSAETNSAYRWDLRLDTYLGEILTRAVQTLLDDDTDNTLKNGDHFQFYVSAHDKGRPRLDPVAVLKAPTATVLAPLQEQDIGEITVLPDDAGPMASGPAPVEDEEIEVKVEFVEDLIKPKSKSMTAYADKESVGQISEQDIPIFMKRSAMKQARKSASTSAESLEEVGGFLLGNVFCDSGTGRLFVEISEVVEADEARGTAVTLDFNYSAWRQVIDRIDKDFPDKTLVGWYHTHLISQAVVLPVEEAENEYIAGYVPFFSPPDMFVHSNFFPNPWHVALVMDLRCDLDVFFAWQAGNIRGPRSFYVYGE